MAALGCMSINVLIYVDLYRSVWYTCTWAYVRASTGSIFQNSSMLTYDMRIQRSMIMYCIDKANAITVLLWWQLENLLLARSVRIISGDNLHFYPRPVLAHGYTVVACSSLPCVCVSIIQSIGTRCAKHFNQDPYCFGGQIDLDLQGQI